MEKSELKILEQIKEEGRSLDEFESTVVKHSELTGELKEEIIQIYHRYQRVDSIDAILEERVNKVLEIMFKSTFNYDIPMNFIESKIGRFLFKIKLSIEAEPELYYGIKECTILANKSRSMMVKEFKNGNLKGTMVGGHYYTTKANVLKYLVTVGRKPFSEGEAKERLRKFKKLKDKGYTMEKIAVEMVIPK